MASANDIAFQKLGLELGAKQLCPLAAHRYQAHAAGRQALESRYADVQPAALVGCGLARHVEQQDAAHADTAGNGLRAPKWWLMTRRIIRASSRCPSRCSALGADVAP